MSLQLAFAKYATPPIPAFPDCGYVSDLISRATLAGRQKEREAIGKELHDDINQLLAASMLYLDMAKTDEAQKKDMIEQSEKFISCAIRKIRDISHSMVAPLLESPLGRSLHELVDSMQVVQPFMIDFTYDVRIDQFVKDVQLALFRIVQEQLNNISKYANAKNVRIACTLDKCISLTIKDDGKGFDMAAKVDGIGLRNIRKRAEQFGGLFSMNSRPGKGCSLYIKIPVNGLRGRH